jgi:hypothetical protein
MPAPCRAPHRCSSCARTTSRRTWTRCGRFLRATGTEIAGIEYIETADGRVVTYDVNTNTNYNPDVEAQAERSGPREIARYLGRLLDGS